METKELIFNQEERTIIAEYIFGYNSETLIKSEGLDLIKVLHKYELINIEKHDSLKKSINNNDSGIGDLLYHILLQKIDCYATDCIMKEYYGK